MVLILIFNFTPSLYFLQVLLKSQTMIARIWHKEIFSEKGNEFLEYIKQTCLTGIKETNGNLVVEILRRDDEKLTHFFIIS